MRFTLLPVFLDGLVEIFTDPIREDFFFVSAAVLTTVNYSALTTGVAAKPHPPFVKNSKKLYHEKYVTA